MKYENLVFTSKRGKQIVFDDFVKEDDEEYKEGRPYWVEMCPHCHRKYRKILLGHFDRGGQATCSVKGCNNVADYYVDFYSTDNIKIIMEEE